VKKILKNLFYFQSLIFPSFVFAQNFQILRNFVIQFGTLVRVVFPIVFGLITMFFIWGVAVFMLNAGDSKLREEGKQRMFWGIVGMFVVVSLFGIVAFLNRVFGVPASCSNPGDYGPGC
jgi:uncharacterized membrane protein YkvI